MSTTVMQPTAHQLAPSSSAGGISSFPSSTSQTTFNVNNLEYRDQKRQSSSTSSYHTTNSATGTSSLAGKRVTNRMANRYSVTAMYSMAAEQDVEVEDELARGEL
jgi:protein required for attachment to host cells